MPPLTTSRLSRPTIATIPSVTGAGSGQTYYRLTLDVISVWWGGGGGGAGVVETGLVTARQLVITAVITNNKAYPSPPTLSQSHTATSLSCPLPLTAHQTNSNHIKCFVTVWHCTMTSHCHSVTLQCDTTVWQCRVLLRILLWRLAGSAWSAWCCGVFSLTSWLSAVQLTTGVELVWWRWQVVTGWPRLAPISWSDINHLSALINQAPASPGLAKFVSTSQYVGWLGWPHHSPARFNYIWAQSLQ